MPFEFERFEIPGLILIKPRLFKDGRGFFLETFKKSDFLAAGITAEFVQDNHSWSQKNVLRGIHFQRPPFAQGKLVRVIEGEIIDVGVDLRPDSPCYKQWQAVVLNSSNNHVFYLPPGFGHGFEVVSDSVHMLYKCTAEYNPDSDGGILWNDPDVAVNWQTQNPELSEKDKALPLLSELNTDFFRGLL